MGCMGFGCFASLGRFAWRGASVVAAPGLDALPPLARPAAPRLPLPAAALALE